MCRLSRSTLAAECLPRKPAPAFEHFTASRLLLQLKRADVPLELEEIGLPMNTFGPKNPFTGAQPAVHCCCTQLCSCK